MDGICGNALSGDNSVKFNFRKIKFKANSLSVRTNTATINACSFQSVLHIIATPAGTIRWDNFEI